MFLLLASVCIVTAFANPILNEQPVESNIDVYQNAVDFSQLATVDNFNCLRTSGYGVAFLRGYDPTGQGRLDVNIVSNIRNAYNGGVGTEVYLTPQPLSSKNASIQVDELYNGLKNGGITVRTIWLQVTSPINWGSVADNKKFISAAIARIQKYKLSVGIFTSNYDWNLITQNYSVSSSIMLWYWSVLGQGVGGESSPNYSDFRPFGVWKAATVKQYGQYETLCKIVFNRDVFTNSNLVMKAEENVDGPTAGGFIRM